MKALRLKNQKQRIAFKDMVLRYFCDMHGAWLSRGESLEEFTKKWRRHEKMIFATLRAYRHFQAFQTMLCEAKSLRRELKKETSKTWGKIERVRWLSFRSVLDRVRMLQKRWRKLFCSACEKIACSYTRRYVSSSIREWKKWAYLLRLSFGNLGLRQFDGIGSRRQSAGLWCVTDTWSRVIFH